MRQPQCKSHVSVRVCGYPRNPHASMHVHVHVWHLGVIRLRVHPLPTACPATARAERSPLSLVSRFARRLCGSESRAGKRRADQRASHPQPTRRCSACCNWTRWVQSGWPGRTRGSSGAAPGGGTMLRHKNVAFPLGVITQTPYRFAGNHDSERPHHLSPCRSCTHRPRTCMIVIPLRSVMYNMYHRQRFTLGQTQHVPTVR